MTMANKRPQYDLDFKKNAVKYYNEHKELGISGCATNLGIGKTTLHKWVHQTLENDNEVPFRGSGNYSSDIEKENVRLKKELKDTKDALEILKKAINIMGS